MGRLVREQDNLPGQRIPIADRTGWPGFHAGRLWGLIERGNLTLSSGASRLLHERHHSLGRNYRSALVIDHLSADDVLALGQGV